MAEPLTRSSSTPQISERSFSGFSCPSKSCQFLKGYGVTMRLSRFLLPLISRLSAGRRNRLEWYRELELHNLRLAESNEVLLDDVRELQAELAAERETISRLMMLAALQPAGRAMLERMAKDNDQHINLPSGMAAGRLPAVSDRPE